MLFEKWESKDYGLIENAEILWGISKRWTREQSPDFVVTVNSIDQTVEKSQASIWLTNINSQKWNNWNDTLLY